MFVEPARLSALEQPPVAIGGRTTHITYIMTSIAHSVSNTFKGLSTVTKLFLLAFVLLFAAVKVSTMENSYTRLTYVSATVIAKTQMPGSRSSSTPYFILATRHPDGTLEDVYTSFARYSTTEIGSKWGVYTSDSIKDLPVPGFESARRILAVCLALGFVCSLAFAIGAWIDD